MIASELFAREVHDTWGIGLSDSNNGVLIFLSLEDRIVYLSTGSGVSSDLNTRKIDQIIENMKPYLRNHDYGKAIEHAVKEIDLILTKKHQETSYTEMTEISMFVLSMLGFFLWNHRRRYTLERGKQHLDKLMKEIDDCKKNNVFINTSCPICLEDYPTEVSPKSDGDLTSEVPVDVKSVSDVKELSPNPSKLPNRPMVLRCGHSFCFTCLSTHLKSVGGSVCPICRANVSDVGSAPKSSSPLMGDNSISCESSVHRQSEERNTTLRVFDIRRPEIMFRMSRMRVLYPDIMTSSVYSNSLQAGNFDELRAVVESRRLEVTKLITDLKSRSDASASGSLGSTSRFSGGRSSGGRAGKW